jgi:methionyl-tRNA formyltransferase
MHVLLLSPYPEGLIVTICDLGDEVTIRTAPVVQTDADFIVSYGYRHLLRRPLLGSVPAVNLHISYLPWNRGADPNLWSWIDDTPKGVTIHDIDEGMDTGPIIAQRLVDFGDNETLASSYAKLRRAVEEVFEEVWPMIRDGSARRTPQRGHGSSHRVRDRAAIGHLLTQGWDTPVRELRRLTS